jgi:hypothetical protein
VIGLMKYNPKKNFGTSRRTVSAGGEKNQLMPCPITAAPTSPPGGVLRCIRLLEYVLARWYATTGLIGLGLHRTTWAALRSIGSWRDSTEHPMGASRGPDLVGPGRLTCYAIGTTASADPRGIFLPPYDW